MSLKRNKINTSEDHRGKAGETIKSNEILSEVNATVAHNIYKDLIQSFVEFRLLSLANIIHQLEKCFNSHGNSDKKSRQGLILLSIFCEIITIIQ